jgi:D-amino-acid oxidase
LLRRPPNNFVVKIMSGASVEIDKLWMKRMQEWFAGDSDGGVLPKNAIVLGAGVIGLTVALALSTKVKVTIIADDFESPTSSTAAAVWHPFLSEDVRTEKWSRDTFEMAAAFVTDVEGACNGQVQNLSLGHTHCCPDNPVVRCDALTVSRHIGQTFPSIAAWLPQRKLVGSERLPHTEWQSGVEWQSIVIQSHLMLPMLRRLCQRNSVHFEQKKVLAAHLHQLRALQNTIVINCTGFGAGALLGDAELLPIRGQIVKVMHDVKLCGLPRFVDCDDDDEHGLLAYVIPRIDCLVLGGTADRGETSREISDEVSAGILARCDRLVPGVAQCTVLRAQCDLRPARRGAARVDRVGDWYVIQ